MRSFPRLAVLMTTGALLVAADAPKLAAQPVPPPPPAAPAAPAMNPDIVAQRGDVQLHLATLRAALSHIDQIERDKIVANPQLLQNFVKNLMIRQILLGEAHTAKFEQDATAAAAIKDATDIALAQQWLLAQAKVDPAYPNAAELQAAYEANKANLFFPPAYHVQQIAILVPANATKEQEADALKKIKEIRAQLMKPKADFADIAMKQSQDPISAPKGGDLGWLPESQIIPQIRDALKALAVNTISEPIRGKDAWHLIRLVESKPQTTATLEQVKVELTNAMRQAKAKQLSETYLEGLLKAQPVNLNDIGLADRLKAAN